MRPTTYLVLAIALLWLASSVWLPERFVNIVFTIANVAGAIYLLSCWLLDRKKARA